MFQRYLVLKKNKMQTTSLDATYWQDRYSHHDTPWDIGSVSPPLRHFFDNLPDKKACILIPGAGNAYEAVYLHEQGFDNVWVCDWAPQAFEHLNAFAPDFPNERKLVADYFELDLKVDLIVEQTFFCAIHPDLRRDYARKSAQLLKPSGILAGLLFSVDFEKEGPPFGGSAQEYEAIFSDHFDILDLSPCSLSIGPRAGRELWVHFKKK